MSRLSRDADTNPCQGQPHSGMTFVHIGTV
jgi:hypothetical protein